MTLGEVQVNLSSMVNLKLMDPVTILLVLMCEQSWHQGESQGKYQGEVEGFCWR